MMFTALVGFVFWLSPTAQHSAEKCASIDLQNELPSASLGCQGFKLLFEMLWFGVHSSTKSALKKKKKSGLITLAVILDQ